MGAGEILQELSDVMMGSGQLVADEIANTTRNGCFEYCDGWPEELRREAEIKFPDGIIRIIKLKIKITPERGIPNILPIIPFSEAVPK